MPAALSIVLGGVNITTSVDLTSVTMQLAGSQEIATCEFDIVDPTDAITAADEATLSVTEVGSSTVLFGGFVRSRSVAVIATGRIIHITAVDYNSLLDRSIVVSDSRVAGESDRTRLIYLMTTYGSQFSSTYTGIATLNGSLPAQKFIALTLRQAIERVLGQASTKSSYYVDPTGKLNTYDRSVVTAAPYDVVVGTPAAGQLAPETFSIDNDASNLANAIYIVGATAAGSGWFTDTTSISTYGRRERFFNAPDADTHAKAQQVGLAVLEDQKNPVPRGVFTTQSPKDGWRIGQSIAITSPAHGLVAATYRIARVTVKYLDPAGDRDYTIEVGAPLRTLSTLLAAAHGGGGGFPWHSPGGAGGWAPVIGSAGHTGGGVSGGGGCACNTPYGGCSIFDSGNRVVVSGWGTSDAGYEWAVTGDAFNNGSSNVLLPFDLGVALSQSAASISATGPWDGPFTATIKMLFLTVPVGTTPTSTYQISIGGPGSASLAFAPSATLGEMTIWSGSGSPSVGINAAQASLSWTANVWYLLKWEHLRGRTGQDRVKVWLDGSPEPASWDITFSGFTGTTPGPSFELLDIGIAAHTFERWYFDYIEFCGDATSGQPYPWTDLGTGNGVQTSFSTLTAFRAGSLEVRVDATTVMPASQYTDSPAGPGGFTFSYAPSLIEHVWAKWVVA